MTYTMYMNSCIQIRSRHVSVYRDNREFVIEVNGIEVDRVPTEGHNIHDVFKNTSNYFGFEEG